MSKALMRRVTGLCVFTLAIHLTGCAGYGAYKAGLAAVDRGAGVEGIDLLAEAVSASPDNTDYRRALYSKRQQVVAQLLIDAHRALDGGEVSRAEGLFGTALRLQPDLPVARSGLARAELARRHQAMLENARNALQSGDAHLAQEWTRQILSENVNHRAAQALLKTASASALTATDAVVGTAQLAQKFRTPVSVTLQSASIKSAFDAIRLASGLNFVLDKDVQSDARISIAVSNKPVEDVLRIVLATNQLEHKPLDGDTLLIYPKGSARTADYKDVVVRAFYLNNAEASKVAAMLKSIGRVKEVFVDERVNLLMIRDAPEVVRLAERLIAAQDMAEPEVMLKLEVMEVSANRLLEMGLRLPESISASVQGAAGTPGVLTADEFKAASQGLLRITLPSPLASLTLRSQVGDANILANPTVRVKNRQTAKVLIGEKVPVITTSTTANVGVAESVSYLDVGLKMDIEPTISLDGEVTMKLNLEVSNILDTITRSSGTQTYRLGTRTTATTLRVRDGETNVLAGLIQREERQSNGGWPGLNEFPVLNKIFGASSGSDKKTEIVLLITPQIVRDLDTPILSGAEFVAGTESSNGARSVEFRERALPHVGIGTAQQTATNFEGVAATSPPGAVMPSAPQAPRLRMPESMKRALEAGVEPPERFKSK
ncbi:general secretion pathway protein GspD [Aquabacterium lacunae]|uniref:General secretion pathway protein GspD n=1 Tax=Aquabacterium lacunae TaxID=2528630 RepID=A0A4Q9GXU9_9BURK|nr:secretin N-terminal domain-containing protein [Aquabacterium lacunae]TBO30447.1 general secretion pathway protein GspD [Aquabacterium lacunae]